MTAEYQQQTSHASMETRILRHNYVRRSRRTIQSPTSGDVSVYRFSNCKTGGELGRGMAKMSFVACPIYMKKAQRMDTFLATAPSTFHTLRENRPVVLSLMKEASKSTRWERIRCRKFHCPMLRQTERSSTKTKRRFDNPIPTTNSPLPHFLWCYA